MKPAPSFERAGTDKQLGRFERYLTLSVASCMLAGVALGLLAPGMTDSLRRLEFGAGSHINVPIAVLIWLMITPMMMKVDFAAVKNVGKRPRGLMVTLFVNWLVKPFSMALFAWIFLLSGTARIYAIPELQAIDAPKSELSHEAAVGPIADEAIEYLMTRGLTRDVAVATLTLGFLKIELPGLPTVVTEHLERVMAATAEGRL